MSQDAAANSETEVEAHRMLENYAIPGLRFGIANDQTARDDIT